MEELGVTITTAQAWTFVHQEYKEKAVLLLFFHIEIHGEPAPQEGQEIAWVTGEEAQGMSLPAGDAKALKTLVTEFPG